MSDSFVQLAQAARSTPVDAAGLADEDDDEDDEDDEDEEQPAAARLASASVMTA